MYSNKQHNLATATPNLNVSTTTSTATKNMLFYNNELNNQSTFYNHHTYQPTAYDFNNPNIYNSTSNTYYYYPSHYNTTTSQSSLLVENSHASTNGYYYDTNYDQYSTSELAKKQSLTNKDDRIKV